MRRGGCAPKYANLDRVNPGSVVLSGEMMLRYLGWTEAADLILKGLHGAIRDSPGLQCDEQPDLRQPHGWAGPGHQARYGPSFFC